MINKRQYVAIILIMAAVFLLFQGTQLGREHWGGEQVNTHTVETGLRSDSVWTQETAGRNGETDTVLNARSILFLGSADSPEGEAAAEWANYAKRPLTFIDSDEIPGSMPELVLADRDALVEKTAVLRTMLDRGVSVMCLSLPEAETIGEDAGLQQLLGIQSVHRDSVSLKGYHLFEGFLLGGERIYVHEDGIDSPMRQELPQETPWYIVRSGTETFLQGILCDEEAAEAEEQKLKNEDMPAIIWRHHCGSAEVFAVNGSFMADRAIAGGILQAACSYLEDVSLYPVLNAQLFSMLDFPALSDENSAVMQSLYGREMTLVTQNVILPSLISLPNRYGIVFTAFTAPQFDYDDELGPRRDMAQPIMKTFSELRSELALSLRRSGDTPLEKKLAADSDLLEEEPSPRITAVFAEKEDLSELPEMDAPCLREVCTVVAADDDAPPLGYWSENVTIQRLTADVTYYSDLQDFRMLCRETAMGYDSSYCDLGSIWWPESEEDRWQKRAETVFSNLTTYRSPFAAFDSVTASECDVKIRHFLKSSYEYSRSGDEITLQITPLLTEASYILRLHGEKLVDMEGGEWTEIEDGAFLLRADSGYVRLRVAPSGPLASLGKGAGG